MSHSPDMTNMAPPEASKKYRGHNGKSFTPEAVAARERRKEQGSTDPYQVTRQWLRDDPDRLREANALVERWARWSRRYANVLMKKYRVPKILRPEMYQAAHLGITEASRLYDESEGGSFAGYSVWFMRKEIQATLQRSSKVLQLPRNWRNAMKAVSRMMTQMAREGIETDFEGACDRLGITEKQRHSLRAMRKVFKAKVSTITNTADVPGWTLEEFLGDTREEGPVGNAIRNEGIQAVRDAMMKLPEEYRTVVIDHINGVPHNVTKAALGISKPTVLRYRLKAFEWLRFFLGEGPQPLKPITLKDPASRTGYFVFTPPGGTPVPLPVGYRSESKKSNGKHA